MQAGIVRLVRGLVAQQIAVGPRVEQGLIALPAPLPQGKSHRAARTAPLDLPDDILQHLVGIEGVLPALEHEGAEAQPEALLRALDDLLSAETVAPDRLIGAAEAAVEAVVFADIREFDQPAQLHVGSDVSGADAVGAPA